MTKTSHTLAVSFSAFLVVASSAYSNTPPDREGHPGDSIESLTMVDTLGASPEPLTPTQAASDDVWDRIRSGFQLDHQTDRREVRAEIDWFAGHQDYIDRFSERARPHLSFIVTELEKQNLPLELALLPVVESAFDPFAYSHGRASGLWQFIPATARLQGLRIDWWYDGRRDVVDSTHGAIDYLQHLNARLDDDWLLALAAYNSGEGNVRGAIRRQPQGRRDFWSLHLPRETQGYVPRLLAISAVVADPEKYGITLKPISMAPYWKAVDIGSQLDLARAASLADMKTADLYQLNSGFNQWSTHPEGPHRLLLPADRVDSFEANLANLPPEERISWRRHKIRPGESLGLIAQRYRTTVDTLTSVNDIRGNLIRAGDSLLIPTASAQQQYLTADARLARDQAEWKDKYGLDPTQHQVEAGDSLWKLSLDYGVSMRQIARWNGIGTTTTIYPGQELVIFATPVANMTEIAAPPDTEVLRKVNYRVRKGESLALIANKFNLTVNNIRKWNREAAAAKYLQPGDRLTLYVDVTGTD